MAGFEPALVLFTQDMADILGQEGGDLGKRLQHPHQEEELEVVELDAD